MTHNDIYTKFMIEYDKANVTSSYPSLTKYEVATILDKAYHAFIAQKVTGNNPRGAQFEADVKAIADIQPLIVHKDLAFNTLSHDIMAINVSEMKLPDDFMYYVQMLLEYVTKGTNLHVQEASATTPNNHDFIGDDLNETLNLVELYYGSSDEVPQLGEVPDTLNWHDMYYSTSVGDPINSLASDSTITTGTYDKTVIRVLPVKLVSHAIAERFMATQYNMPWVKNPVAYIQNNNIYAVYDPINKPEIGLKHAAHLVYIKKPAPFATSIKNSEGMYNKGFDFSEDTKFELLDSAAQEVISLAVIMALENVESSRLNTKINIRGLES